MTQPEDILTDFEEKGKPLKWHDELTICCIGLIVFPIILFFEVMDRLNERRGNEKPLEV